MTEIAALPVFETKRLILRGVTLKDAPSIQRYFNDYEIVRDLAARIPWPYPDNGAIDFLTKTVLPR